MSDPEEDIDDAQLLWAALGVFFFLAGGFAYYLVYYYYGMILYLLALAFMARAIFD